MRLGYPDAKTDLAYGWKREALEGCEAMPLSVQVIGLPWKKELVLRVMQESQEKAKSDYKLCSYRFSKAITTNSVMKLN